MPYTKSKYRRRTYRRKAPQSSFQKYGPSIASIAATAATMVAKRYLNTETKFYDSSVAQTPNNVTGTSNLLNAMGQGASSEQRVGNSIRMKSVFFQGRVNIHASATSSTVRLALVLDRQANGAAPSYSSAAGGNGIYENATVDSWRDMGNTKRYTILATRRIVVDSDDPEKTFLLKSKLPYAAGKVAYYPGVSAGSIGDISTGSLYLFCFSDEVTNVPSVDGRVRVRYLDN